MPLHKVQTFPLFYEDLYKCSILFLDKDPTLAKPLLQGILNFWPFANSPKELFFLALIAEIMDKCEIESLKSMIPAIFKKLRKCIESQNM